MSFDRFRVQTEIENELGCNDLNKWNQYYDKLKNYKISETRKNRLETLLKEDAADLYYKAVYSIADSIYCISEGRHSWSVVKLYYAVFYLLRCSLATKRHAFIRNKQIFTILLEDNEIPIPREKKKIHGDHATTIATYIDLVGDDDILQTNKVQETNVYHWIMELRNRIHYRERAFQEPTQQHFVANLFNKQTAKDQIEEYLCDKDPKYCFLEDHCCLAAPLKLASIVRNDIGVFLERSPLDQPKQNEIKKLVSSIGLDKSNIFAPIYS
ncbi:MAG: hypothetical protein F9K32_00930 [Desulfobulbaceae bacterium]|nr:MAG: hypothetical protein F9K32_00930 [Desulfobulbaceae bacterium]